MATTVIQAFNEFLKDIVNLDSDISKTARSSRDWLLGQISKFNEKDNTFPKLYSDINIHFGSFARKTKIRELDDIDLMIGLTGQGSTYSKLNLKRLAAQRQLYSDAKKMMHIQFAISGMAVIVFAIIGNIISKEYAVYITVLSILCVLFDELFLTKRIENLRLNAAIIQEDFDCDVLQIPFNYIKNSHGTMLETIQENSKKYLSKNKNFDLLVNWYPGMDMADLKYGRIICQSTNCWWNQKLREKYSNFLILSTATIFIFLLLIALFNGITLSGFIMSVISPILPGGVLVYKIDRDNKKAIQNLNDMKNKLDSIIERLRAKELYPDEKLQNDIRCLQDMIFENRSASPLIPDRFYFRYRDRYEDIAQTSNKELVELIKTQYNE